jgi:plasmid maintenance system antidote protein VapI
MTCLSEVLQEAFKDKDLDEAAEKLGIATPMLQALVSGTPNGLRLSADAAVRIGKYTGASPHVILKAQVDDELVELGIAPPEVEIVNVPIASAGKVKEVKASKAKTEKPSRSSTSPARAPARSELRPSTFRLDD